jgi:hypothetical protein
VVVVGVVDGYVVVVGVVDWCRRRGRLCGGGWCRRWLCGGGWCRRLVS